MLLSCCKSLFNVTFLLFIFIISFLNRTVQGQDRFTLTLAHLNDVHARFEETSKTSGRCSVSDKEDNKCFGGFARIHTAVENLRANHPHVLFLSGGDYYQGTVWYTLFKWRVMADLINKIGHDAISLGNHEFDDGIDGLVPFMNRSTAPIVVSNIDHTHEPDLEGLYQKSVVLEKGGRKIGIIGYLTTETKMISRPEKLIITDEVTAVRKEAQKLKSEGVDIIIAVGHAGYLKDQSVARNVEEVDVVIGGHTNTFLYNGPAPSIEDIKGPYPKVVQQQNGRRVPVVQAYAFGKYLGVLEVTFNPEGEVVEWRGNPLLLDGSVEQDPTILEALVPWRRKLEAAVAQVVGKTFVFLDGRRQQCRLRECNLGNLVADAMIHINTKYPDDLQWSSTGIAIVNGGSIRSSIDVQTSNGTITLEDIMSVSPFRGTIEIIELEGRYLKAAFEYAVQGYSVDGDLPGKFLQVSGIRVVYDLNLPTGSRVVSLRLRCTECRVPKLEDIQLDKIYKIATTSFIANGGDGYDMIKDNIIKHHMTGSLDTDVLLEYIETFSPIYIGMEDRISFIDSSSLCQENHINLPSATDDEDNRRTLLQEIRNQMSENKFSVKEDTPDYSNYISTGQFVLDNINLQAGTPSLHQFNPFTSTNNQNIWGNLHQNQIRMPSSNFPVITNSNPGASLSSLVPVQQQDGTHQISVQNPQFVRMPVFHVPQTPSFSNVKFVFSNQDDLNDPEDDGTTFKGVITMNPLEEPNTPDSSADETKTDDRSKTDKMNQPLKALLTKFSRNSPNIGQSVINQGIHVPPGFYSYFFVE